MASNLKSLAPILALGCCGCITGGYYRQQLFEPVAHETVASLEIGKSTLAEALQALGAPLLVWEWRGDGMALAWGWSDAARWGFSVSVPVGDSSSANAFSWDSLVNNLPGAVFFFGPDDVLVEAREGRLAEIRAETMQSRPAALPEDAP